MAPSVHSRSLSTCSPKKNETQNSFVQCKAFSSTTSLRVFQQVLGVICSSCLTTNLAPFSTRLVRCGVCGTLSLVSSRVDEKENKKEVTEARRTEKAAATDDEEEDVGVTERRKERSGSRGRSGSLSSSEASSLLRGHEKEGTHPRCEYPGETDPELSLKL